MLKTKAGASVLSCRRLYKVTSQTASPLLSRHPSLHINTPFVLRLTDDELVVFGEVVRGDLEVERGGSLSYAAGDIVVRAVAGAEPSTVVTSLADGHASQVSADACLVLKVSHVPSLASTHHLFALFQPR